MITRTIELDLAAIPPMPRHPSEAWGDGDAASVLPFRRGMGGFVATPPALCIGNGQLIDAPHTGAAVRGPAIRTVIAIIGRDAVDVCAKLRDTEQATGLLRNAARNYTEPVARTLNKRAHASCRCSTQPESVDSDPTILLAELASHRHQNPSRRRDCVIQRWPNRCFSGRRRRRAARYAGT